MKVILLGAKGMLAHALADVFSDHILAAWDREDVDITDGEALKRKFEQVSAELQRNTTVSAELQRNTTVSAKLLSKSKAGVSEEVYVLNAAAYNDVDGAEQDKHAAYLVNETGVGNVAVAAKQIGAKVVHYSTDYVFPGDSTAGYLEEDKPGSPINVYGASKLAGEQVLLTSGVESYLIRTAWLYGSQGKNFVDTILRLSQEHDSLEVVSDQFGSPTYTVDLARATRALVEGFTPGVYHLTNSGVTTWYDFASEIVSLAGRAVQLVPVTAATYARPAPRPVYGILKNTKGPAMRSWHDALSDYLENQSVINE